MSEFQILFIQQAVKDWKTLDSSVRQKLKKAIDRLKINPSSYGKDLGGSLHGLRRIRAGDYRIVYRILEAYHKVEVIVICHRKDVYRIAHQRRLI